jgi:two-component system sensor histidine kinase KdpD
VLVVIATLGGVLVDAFITLLDPANLVMFYLLTVVIVALRFGYGPAFLTAVLSVMVFNFFFVPPQLTFHVKDAQYLLTFLGLLAAGVVIANLTAHARRQTEAAERRENETAQLYSLSREFSATINPEVIVKAVVDHAREIFQCEAGIFLPDDKGQISPKLLTPNFHLSGEENAAVEWAFKHGHVTGFNATAIPNAQGRYIPLKSAQNIIGVLGLCMGETVTIGQQHLMAAFAAQSALAIEAAQLGQEAQQAQLLREKEKFQTAILNSVSHDLRTPLVSITGALSTLRDNVAVYDDEAKRDLLDGAYEEAERLNRLVGNLLDMSRLEGGRIRLKQELYDLEEIIGVARTQMRERLINRQLLIQLPQDLPMVSVDLVLIAQVFVNLLENALKYSPVDMPIEIAADQHDQEIRIVFKDRGIGIPEADLPHIFEKFYRASSADFRGGSGLGLSICQGIVEAHGGRISAHNREGGGTCIIIELPLN